MSEQRQAKLQFTIVGTYLANPAHYDVPTPGEMARQDQDLLDEGGLTLTDLLEGANEIVSADIEAIG